MSRLRREEAILEIVGDRTVRTQEELVQALEDRGIRVTQSTVSRDIHRLGLVKVPAAGGGARYAPPEAVNGTSSGAREGDLSAAFREYVRGVAAGDALLALHTPPGCADTVAVAIDEAKVEGVVATLAGDDTILVLLEDAGARGRVRDRFETLMR